MGEDSEASRQRLGDLVIERRRALRLSVNAAAQAAGIDRATWTGVERGTRQTEDYTYAKMERVLGWGPGSVTATLAGGTPTIAPRRAPAGDSVEDLIADIWSSALPDDRKRALVRDIRRAEAAAAAERQAAEDELRRWREAG